MRKIFLLVFLSFPFIVFAQTGKIVGTVTDVRNGEPLIGANVTVEGTLLGTATDIDGQMLILNVGPGNYNFRASYVGYQDLIIENIRVSVNLTTEVNFELREEVLESDAIVVVAERPLINKNVTNSNTIISAKDIENLPLRGVNAIVSQQAGVVNYGGDLYVRGSRLETVAFYLDGVLVNDALYGGPATTAITNAIEEIQFQAGGYSAEYGNANGGIISTHTKTGGENYHINVELITDNFVPVGKKYLGGYSYGQSESVLTIGGPVIPTYKNLRFFVAASNQFERSPQKFYMGIDEKDVFDPVLAASGTADTFDVYYPEGYMVGADQNTYSMQGNLTWDLNPLTLRFNGSYRYSEGRNGVDIADYNTRDRVGVNEGETITANLKLIHVLGRNSFYDVSVNYYDNFTIPHMDPIFRHNISAYGDSIENSKIGTLLEGDDKMPEDLNAYGQTFRRRVQPWNQYDKRRQSSWGITANFLYQLGKHNEIKIGTEYKRYEMRWYHTWTPTSIAGLVRSVADRDPRDVYAYINHFGYDMYGNKVDEGPQGPKYPVFAGFYLQDKLEFNDLIINAGLRFDYYFTDDQDLVNPHNIIFNEDDRIDPSSLVDVKPFTHWSPRLGFSFPVTEKTIFHAQYGKFYQQSKLRDIYSTYDKIAKNRWDRLVGFGIKPERTTQYELGFRQQLGHNFAFDLTIFYKDIKDQIRGRPIYAEPDANHGLYYALVNGDFETVKGVEIKMDLRRSSRVAGSFDYTFSDALGTGSNSWDLHRVGGTGIGEIFFLQQTAPVDFNQTHRGSVILDYRFGIGDGGPVLQRLGLNLLFQFTSGFNYTRGNWAISRPVESLNFSTTPWTYRLDMKLDKSFRIGQVDVNLYLWITNVFNRQNVVQVFNKSNDPYDNGWLASQPGATSTDGYALYGDDKAALHDKLYKTMKYNPDYFGTPRQIRLGLRLDY